MVVDDKIEVSSSCYPTRVAIACSMQLFHGQFEYGQPTENLPKKDWMYMCRKFPAQTCVGHFQAQTVDRMVLV